MSTNSDNSAKQDDPFVIMVAPTGARRTKQNHPNLPITPDEVARTAAECHEAGAAAIHIHVRDRDGAHSLNGDAYRATLAAVRREVGTDMLCQITTEAVGRFTPAEQMACVRDVRPDAVSIAVRELFADASAEVEGGAFLAETVGHGTGVQYIIYDTGDLDRFHNLKRRGIVPDGPSPMILVLGRYTANQQSHPSDLLPFLAAIEDKDIWMTCAFGSLEGASALTAAGLGGHSRVGFENNMHLADGQMAPSNAALVAQTAQNLPVMGRSNAGIVDARRVLGCR